MTSKELVKDDRHLIKAIERGKALRNALGIPEPSETSLGSVAELREEWQRLRQEKTGRNVYASATKNADFRTLTDQSAFDRRMWD